MFRHHSYPSFPGRFYDIHNKGLVWVILLTSQRGESHFFRASDLTLASRANKCPLLFNNVKAVAFSDSSRAPGLIPASVCP